MWPQMDLRYYFIHVCLICPVASVRGWLEVHKWDAHLSTSLLPLCQPRAPTLLQCRCYDMRSSRCAAGKKKKKMVVPVPDIKRNLSQLVWDCLWCPEPPSWWDLCKTLTMRNAIPVDGPSMKGKWALWWLRCGKNPVGPTPRGTFNRGWPPLGSKRTRQVKGRDTHDLLPPSLREMKAGRGKIPVTHSPHQGGPSEGSTLPPAQLQAPQAQRQ